MPELGVIFATAQPPHQTPEDVFSSLREYAVSAEAAGLGCVWVGEHHFVKFGLSPSALTTAAFLLGATQTIAVGTAVTLVPLQPPLFVAEQAAALDHLGGGRFRLGLGESRYSLRSGGKHAVIEKSATGLNTVIGTLSQAWSGGSTHLADETGHVRTVEVTPAPRTPGGPEMLVASGRARVLRYAAQHRLPLMLPWDLTTAQRSRRIAAYAAETERVGLEARSVPHVVSAVGQVADSNTEAAATIRGPVAHWLNAGSASSRPPPLALSQRRAAGILSRGAVGSPTTCAEWLVTNVVDVGASRAALFLDLSGDREVVLENIRRFGGEVLPAVRALLGKRHSNHES